MLDLRPQGTGAAPAPDAAVLAEVDPDVPLAEQMLNAAREAGETMPEAIADFAIDSFDADRLLDRVPRPMSRGEQQICALLITLSRPFDQLWLFDPTAGLDGQRRRALADLLVDLAEDHEIVVESDDPVFDRYRS